MFKKIIRFITKIQVFFFISNLCLGNISTLLAPKSFTNNDSFLLFDGVSPSEYYSFPFNDKIDPKDCFLIKQDNTGTTQYQKNKRKKIITHKLTSCACVTFYDPSTKTGLWKYT